MELKSNKTIRFYTGDDHEHQIPIKANIYQTPKLKENLRTSKVFSEDHEPWQKRILDPGSKMALKWNKIFLVSCLLSLFMDPLYFYLPLVGTANNIPCIKSDVKLNIIVTFFRTLADLFYILNMVIKFRTAYVAPSSRVFGRGEFVMDPKKIAKKYLKKDFFIDLLAALPIPQVVIWWIIPGIRTSNAEYNNNALALIVLIQYVPRLYLIFPLSYHILEVDGVVAKTAWTGAAYNLLLYMIASHVMGAAWYLASVERQTTCWRSECHKENNVSSIVTACQVKFLNCHFSDRLWANKTSVISNCDATNNNTSFQYGIFKPALTSGAASSSFISKYLYCLWWGLQNLSSYGQTLQASTYIGETTFSILIVIHGLVLFAHLIGNMQNYLQSITVRLEEWRLKRRDTEEWMRHRQLPHDLRERVRRFVQYKWLATKGVDEEFILQALPTDLRRDIQRRLCLDLVRRVPFFSPMDDQLLDAICERLVSSLSTQGTYIVREGDPVTEMLFIIRGRLESSTTNGGQTGFFNSITLNPGDFCGEELLAWAHLPKSKANLPTSTRTVRALVEVEAFELRAEDLKFVANQFRRLHSKKMQHTFRFYSHHWRTWAACFIQAAWRRFKRRKIAKDLERELAVLASFACSSSEEFMRSSSMRSFQETRRLDMSKLQKPDEPDFSADGFD